MRSVRVLYASVLLLSACAIGPDYQRPQVETPAAFREWKRAEPGVVDIESWWLAFDDPVLNSLVEALNKTNQDVHVAAARYRQARAVAAAAHAGFFPSLGAEAAITRGDSASVSTNSASSDTHVATIKNRRTLALDASWELDIWGRQRSTYAAESAAAQASAAELAAVVLSAQAELAIDYFQLRVTDAQILLLQQTVAAYQKSFDMVSNRYRVGVVGSEDVAQADAQLRTAQTAAINAALHRLQLEHAIALLVGRAPSEFFVAADEQFMASQFARSATRTLAHLQLPGIPAALPSALLERRPDVAAAEQRVIAANARIGVAQTAYFPTLMLGAEGGFISNSASDWLSLPNRFWAVGPALTQALFDGGLRSANKQHSEAVYDEAVAEYRQTVLTSFLEVEDELSALRLLGDEAVSQDAAVAAARRSVELLSNRYKVGKVAYLDVIAVQTTAYLNARAALQILGERYLAHIRLVKALGGSWDSRQLANVVE